MSSSSILAAPVRRSSRARSPRWAASRVLAVAEARTDARVGGRFLVVMRAGDKDLPRQGTYKTIDRANRLAFTWESPMSPVEGSLVTVDFEDATGGTLVRLNHVRFPSEESRDNHEKGWGAILNALAKAV